MKLKELFSEIASAIREKDGSTEPINAISFPQRIRSLVVDKIIPTDINLSSISIPKLPNKTTYFEGEEFVIDGMVVEAKFSNGMELVVPNQYVTYSPVGALKYGDAYVDITFRWGDVFKTNTCSINVVNS